MCLNIVGMANSVDPDQALHSAASDLDLHCSQRPFQSKYLGLLRYLQSSTCFHISCSFLYPNIFTLEQGINTKLTDISPSCLSHRLCYFSHLYVRYIRKTDNIPNLFFISFLFPVIFFSRDYFSCDSFLPSFPGLKQFFFHLFVMNLTFQIHFH